MVKRFNNPALREESLSQLARVIPPRAQESIFNWIEDSGRFTDASFTSHTEASEEELENILESTMYELDKDDDDDALELDD
jgi:Protein of unknown function (DUF3134)